MRRSNRPNKTADARPYAVITADLVLSRQLKDRARVQGQMRSLLQQLNAEFNQSIVAPFRITLWDEFQGMLRNPADIPKVVMRIHTVFRPRMIRVGIGVGAVSTKLSRQVTEMDGPVFIHARSALEMARKQGLEVYVRTGHDDVDRILNAIYRLLTGIASLWTEKQWERINLYRQYGTLERVAEHVGVTKQAISAGLRNTLWERILETEKQLPAIFTYLVQEAAGKDGQLAVRANTAGSI